MNLLQRTALGFLSGFSVGVFVMFIQNYFEIEVPIWISLVLIMAIAWKLEQVVVNFLKDKDDDSYD